MDLTGVADELYALAPEDFTSARDAVAKAQDDRGVRAQVAALRKPTVSAWLVNLLARSEPDLLGQLTGLGASLAQAQRSGAGDALRELGAQRRTLVSAVAGRAAELAGRALTAAVRAEVEATLEAALSDPAYGEAVRSGRLVRPLSYAGFGVPDLDGAVAVPVTPGATSTGGPASRAGASGTSSGKASGKAGGKSGSTAAAREAAAAAEAEQERAQELARREADALQAAGTLDDAVRAAERAEQVATAAADEAVAAGDAVEQAEQQLEAARVRRTTVVEALAAARREVEVACDRVAEAQQAAERTRAALDALRRVKG